MKSVLSTKILPREQKKRLLKAGFDLVEHDFIRTEPVDFEMPKNIKNAIFTSQNAVKAVRHKSGNIQRCFCVGEKTKKLLQENGLNVVASTDYGKDLAEIIAKKHADESFTFFCGNKRRHELPAILKKNAIPLEEIEVYKTELNPKEIHQKLDGVLFFSPSGVESFCAKNELKNSVAFCIGTTTASEAKKYTDRIVISKKTSIESLVQRTIESQNLALQ